MKNLLEFNGKNKFINFCKEFDIFNWYIKSEPISVKVKRYYNSSIVLKFKKYLYNVKNTTMQTTNIIVLLDSIKIILLSLRNITNELEYKIVFELTLPYYQKRIDAVIFIENKVLLLEFSYSYEKIKPSKILSKNNQLLMYKNILSNYLHKDFTINSYALVYCAECDENKDIYYKYFNIILNQFFNFLKTFFSNNISNKSCYLELKKYNIT